MVNNQVKIAVVPYYHIYPNFCKSRYINGDLYLFVVYYFFWKVNNDFDEIIAVFFLISSIEKISSKIY